MPDDIAAASAVTSHAAEEAMVGSSAEEVLRTMTDSARDRLGRMEHLADRTDRTVDGVEFRLQKASLTDPMSLGAQLECTASACNYS